jgi:F-type H+-transporting ATPase subunit b
LIELNLTAVLSILNFLLLFFVLKKALFDKFFDVLRRRKEKIEGEMAQAEKIRKEANSIKEDYERKLEETRASSEEVITRAEREAEEIRRQAREKAQQEIQRMYSAAEMQIEQEREKAMADLQNVIVTSAVAMVSRFLKEEMDEAARERYARRMLESMGDKE